MDRVTMNALFKRAKLSKRDFSVMLDINYQSVNAWGSNQGIPYWVESWLENYTKAKRFEEISRMVKEMEV